jgi:hypothetical protein
VAAIPWMIVVNRRRLRRYLEAPRSQPMPVSGRLREDIEREASLVE